MSHRAAHWAILQLPATGHEKCVLMVLADFHNAETDRCDPAAKTVGELARCNERTVRRCLESLQEQGFIYVQKRDRKPSQIFFKWGRPGAHQWQKPTADTESAPENEAPATPDLAGATEDEKTPADTESAPPETADFDDTSDTNCGHRVRGVRTLTTQTADTESDEPGINQERTGLADIESGKTKPDSDRPPWAHPAAPKNTSRNPAHGRGTAVTDPPDLERQLSEARQILAKLKRLQTPPADLVGHWEREIDRLTRKLEAA